MNPPALDDKAKTLPEEKALSILQLISQCLSDLQMGIPVDEGLSELASIPKQEFLACFLEDGMRKAFWINAYNIFNLVAMRKRIPQTKWERWQHFSRRQFSVAGFAMSLNDIEHGILRRSKFWWSQGWLRNPFPVGWKKRLQLEKDDPRIHFALNCGANGCPAIRFYTATGVEQELELATMSFFHLEVSLEADTIWVSSLFQMYLGDFGGLKGLRKWLTKYGAELEIEQKRIRFRKYDWTTNLQKFNE